MSAPAHDRRTRARTLAGLLGVVVTVGALLSRPYRRLAAGAELDDVGPTLEPAAA